MTIMKVEKMPNVVRLERKEHIANAYPVTQHVHTYTEPTEMPTYVHPEDM